MKDDDLYDLDGRLINTKGYLIDKDDNIVDYYGLLNLYNSMRFMNAYYTQNQTTLAKFN